MRSYSATAVLNLNRQFQMRSMFTVPFALALQGRMAEQGIVLPPLPGGEALWDWHRHQLFMLAMLDQPARWMELVDSQVSQRLQYPAEHPFHGLHRQLLLAQASSANEGLLDWLDPNDPLQSMVGIKLLNLATALQSDRLPSAAQLHSFLVQEPWVLDDHALGDLLLGAVLLHDRSLEAEQRAYMRERMERLAAPHAWFETLRQQLIAGQFKPPKDSEIQSLGVDAKLFKQALQALHHLVDECRPPRTAVLQALQKGKDDERQDPGLRCAIMALLTWSERMLANMANAPCEPAWKFWKLGSRLDRRSYGLHLLAMFGVKVVPAALGWAALREAIVLLIVPWLVCAMIRRVRDLGYGGVVLAVVLGVSAVVPFMTLILLALPGDKLPNRYGLPPNAPDQLKHGLQTVLRRLNGQ